MKAEGRNEVLWLGGEPPESLRQELLKAGGLELRSVTEPQLQEAARRARGVIIDYQGGPGQFLAFVRKVRESCLDHGLAVGLVQSAASTSQDFQRAAEAANISEQELFPSFFNDH